ncbi:DUF3784 domain-containing protein [Halostella litorea]|uniref:DUF3784 domain-containing protein n=1 Tax=Halostella litorea TaxID=2528831 RepID=UPI0010929D8A|nr:DUF3784 domain-containing protein [Halostella litorea]
MQVPESIAVEWLASGALVVAFGVLVRFRNWTFLVAGYDESTAVPEDVVANVVGNMLLRVGIAVAAFGAVASYVDPPTYLATVVGVLVAVEAARTIYRLNTYAPADG